MPSKSSLLTRGLATRGYKDQRTTRTSWTRTKIELQEGYVFVSRLIKRVKSHVTYFVILRFYAAVYLFEGNYSTLWRMHLHFKIHVVRLGVCAAPCAWPPGSVRGVSATRGGQCPCPVTDDMPCVCFWFPAGPQLSGRLPHRQFPPRSDSTRPSRLSAGFGAPVSSTVPPLVSLRPAASSFKMSLEPTDA